MKFGEIRTISELLSGVEVALSPIVAESAFLEHAKKRRNSYRFFTIPCHVASFKIFLLLA